ncbi:MAG: ArsA family ATPase [Pseudobdellovibrionaceae bacterium]
MKDILLHAKVIVCVGSGGVGKTTVASAIAVRAAQLGRRVLVLTVDPARRLKSTMGLEKEDEAIIKHPSIKGSLTASVIDAKKVFDEFVTRASGSPERVQKILRNKLYVQMSTTLSGSQEFTALEKLYASYESGKYDLIVLDTPPTKHAIDFLEAPQKLSVLFNEKITKWFRDPEGQEKSFFRSLIQTGTRQVLRALESLTGSEFMRELADFFQSIQQWQGQLEKRIAEMHKLLVHPKTHFVLVTSFDEAKLKEAEFFSREIRKSGYQLSGVLINRAYPKGLNLSLKTPGHSELEKLYHQYQNYLASREKVFHSFSIRMSGQGQVLKLPELMNPISDLEGVLEMAQNMEEAEGSSK